MTRVLVTGGRGFIGREAMPLLLERGYEVFAVTSTDRPNGMPGVTFVHADLRDGEAAAALVAKIKPTHLLHLAWVTEHGLFWESPDNSSWVSGSLRLYQAFAEHGGKRAVSAGTCAEYDWSQGKCIEDTTLLEPNSLYGHAKLSLYRLQRALFEEAGISAAWGRIFMCYGPHENPKRFVPSIVAPLLRGEPVKCPVGERQRDLLHIKDIASAFVRLLECEVAGALNIASGEPVKLADVARMIADKLEAGGLLELGDAPAASDEPLAFYGSAARLSDEAGWHPRYGLEEGIERTIDWWKQNP